MSSLFYERLPLSKTAKTKVLTDAVRRRAGIGRAHWKGSLDSIPDSMPYKALIHGYIVGMPQFEQSGFGLVFYGPLGTGKTTLGAIILRNALARGGRCYAIRCGHMVDALCSKERIQLENGAPLLEGLINVNYLLLDDFQRENQPWRERKIEEVLRTRYDEQLPTIITTNMEKDELREIKWMESMFIDSYLSVEIAGINWRKAPPNGSGNGP